MAGERKLKRLGEICEFRGGQGFPQKHQGATVGDYPFIKVSDMELPGNRHRITRANHWIDEATRKELRAKPHPITSTVFAKIGIALTYNRRRLLSRPTIVDNNMMAAVPIESEVVPLFLYYLLKATDFNEVVSGTALPFINGSDLAKMKVEIPPLAEQKAIAAVLGALDDKIELNRRMNATLEAMARALFQSWFVDATANGLPKGWREVPFSETVDIVGGGTPKTSVEEFWNGDIPWFSVVDAPQGSDVYAIDTEKKITQAGVDNSSTQILPLGTIIISARGTVGKVALVGVPMAMNQSCYGLRGKAGAKGFHTYFATQALVSTLQQHAHGSVFSTITRGTLAGVRVVAPPATLVDEFEESVLPLMERIRNNLFESRTLATLRDTLLPKLLNGELSLSAVAPAPAGVGIATKLAEANA